MTVRRRIETKLPQELAVRAERVRRAAGFSKGGFALAAIRSFVPQLEAELFTDPNPRQRNQARRRRAVRGDFSGLPAVVDEGKFADEEE